MFWINHDDPIVRIEHKLGVIFLEIEKMALDLSKLQAGASAAEATITALRAENADLKTKLTDAEAKVENPADQATVDQIGDGLTAAAATPA